MIVCRGWSALPLPLGAVLLAGCYCSHTPAPAADGGGLDGGREVPADGAGELPDAPSADAGPLGGAYWTLEERPAWLDVTHDTACVSHGGRLVIEGGVSIDDDCTVAGPMIVDGERDGALVVRFYVWVRHGGEPPCEAIAGYAERHLLVEAEEGPLRVVNADGSEEVEVVVQPPDAAPCAGSGERDAPCGRDCDCADPLVCVPSTVSSAECQPGVCRRPCDRTGAITMGELFAGDLDCPADMGCRSERTVAAPTCAPASSPSCSGSSDCGDALECRESSDGLRCRWPTGSIGAGAPCVGDRDCGEGLRCVEHAFGRTCETPCRTSTMRCQDGWACGGLPAGRGVCEFIGE